MNEPDPREILDIATLERIEEVLRLRDAAGPDPRRTAVIHDLRIIRNMLVHNMARPDTSTEEDAALEARLDRLLRDLSALEMTSLGTPEARQVRSGATASRVADVLTRQEQNRRADPHSGVALRTPKMSSYLNLDLRVTIWWEPKNPNVIKVCTGDPRFVNDEGKRPGLWISIRRSDRNNWNRLARALADAGRPGPPLVP
jgi:hypothetical protein